MLRATIDLGDPVLAQGTASDPRGVTVDLARDLAGRLAVPLRLACFDAARDSFTAVRDGLADLCFLAIEPARESDIAFTAPDAVIEGVDATVTEALGLDVAAGIRAPVTGWAAVPTGRRVLEPSSMQIRQPLPPGTSPCPDRDTDRKWCANAHAVTTGTAL